VSTTTEWPFGTDADRDDPLTAHRIAVASPWAQWNYITAFDRDSEARPTDAEIAMLASFHLEYLDHWYGDNGWRRKMAERALDVDGGANGVTFHKYGPDDWAYRRRTWQYGPTFVPDSPRLRGLQRASQPLGPLTLPEVMDRIHTIGDDEPTQRWLDWKTAHPEVFPA
jgi:hypothetical protein